MKKIIVFLLMFSILLVTGCGSKNPSMNADSEQQDYEQFTATFQDTYDKCLYTYLYLDVNELILPFKNDIYEYEDEFEVYEYDEEIIKTFTHNNTKYYWIQDYTNGCDMNFYGPLTDAEYDEALVKADAYMDSLEVTLEIVSKKESSGVRECQYRQIVNGVPVSVFQGHFIRADVGKNTGVQIALGGLIDKFTVIDTYDSDDFLPLKAVNEILEVYMYQEGIICNGEPLEVEVTMQDVEIVYFFSEENSQSVLMPVYEIDVLEDNSKVHFKATYLVDVFTGYVYDRAGDKFW